MTTTGSTGVLTLVCEICGLSIEPPAVPAIRPGSEIYVLGSVGQFGIGEVGIWFRHPWCEAEQNSPTFST